MLNFFEARPKLFGNWPEPLEDWPRWTGRLQLVWLLMAGLNPSRLDISLSQISPCMPNIAIETNKHTSPCSQTGIGTVGG